MTATASNSLLNRVRKLLALAGNNPAIHKAEAEMAKAQQLIARHNISEEMLKVETGDETFGDVVSVVIHRSGRVANWLAWLTDALAEVNGCESYTSPKEGIIVVGEHKDIGLIQIMFDYLKDEVIRLCKLECRKRNMTKSQGRVFANRFKVGASDALGKRLRRIHQEAHQEARAGLPEGSYGLTVVNNALARIDNKLTRAKAAMPKITVVKVRHRSCQEGYQAGVRAGNNIRLQPNRLGASPAGNLRG